MSTAYPHLHGINEIGRNTPSDGQKEQLAADASARATWYRGAEERDKVVKARKMALWRKARA